MINHSFTVLIADDEYWIRENLRNLFPWEEYSFSFLEPAVDGEDALQKVQKWKPDIVITDINMPFICGTDLIVKLKASYPDIIIFVLSGYNDFDYVRKSLLGGAIDYLLKPVVKRDLLQVLIKATELLIQHRALKEEQAAVREKLLFASSALMDQELSQLIHHTEDERLNEEVQLRLADYELEFSGFTLLLFQTVNLQRIAKKQNKDVITLICNLKNIISQQMQMGNHIILNYIYKRNQFLVITDLNKERLELICNSLLCILQSSTGFGVTAVIGRYYFSFSSLREAYDEALSAQLIRPYNEMNAKLHVEHSLQNKMHKRITNEQEKRLTFAVRTKNRELYQNIVFKEICLQNCIEKGWLFGEVRQLAYNVAWILRNHSLDDHSPVILPTMDHFIDLLLLAVDSFSVEEICSIIQQMMDEYFGIESLLKKSEWNIQTVRQIEEYIEQNYFEEISLTALSKQFLIDSSYLSRSFKQVTGENFTLYLAKKRIERAKCYMKEAKLNITEISQLVGYDDYAYFNRVFRKIVGISPRKYKEQLYEKTEE